MPAGSKLDLRLKVYLDASALALPSARERFEKRAALRPDPEPHRQPRQSLPFQHVDGSYRTETDVVNSTNCTGIVITRDTSTRDYVPGTFKVPTPTEPEDGIGPHAASAWVGIDSYQCTNAILQAGLDFTVNDDGSLSMVYSAWHEWYPRPSQYFTNISFNASNVVKIYASIVIVIESLTQKTTVTQDMSGPALCPQDAEWIVE